MYSKGSSVFGALPSLHCAYPLLLVIQGWRSFGPKLRAVALAYYAAMVFSAVYLDHHWIIDALLGSAYAATVAGAMWLYARLRESEAPLPSLPSSVR
jgi:membrane-associated phospholipid phosphatase